MNNNEKKMLDYGKFNKPNRKLIDRKFKNIKNLNRKEILQILYFKRISRILRIVMRVHIGAPLLIHTVKAMPTST